MFTMDPEHSVRCSRSDSESWKTPGPAHPERFVRGMPKIKPLHRDSLDQPTDHIDERRAYSVNRNGQCLKVLDRFRTSGRVLEQNTHDLPKLSYFQRA